MTEILYKQAFALKNEIELAKQNIKDLHDICSHDKETLLILKTNANEIEVGKESRIRLTNLKDEYEFKLLFETLKRHRETILEVLEEKFKELGV